MHEESRRLEVDVAAIRATVERLVVEEQNMRAEILELRREVRGDIQGLDNRTQADIQRLAGRMQTLEARALQTLLGVLATLATMIGALIALLVG